MAPADGVTGQVLPMYGSNQNAPFGYQYEYAPGHGYLAVPGGGAPAP